MNVAIPFSRKFEYSNQDIQWNIKYKPKIKQLENFITEYGTHRINLIITDFKSNRDIQIISALKEKFSNTELVIVLPFYDEKLEKVLQDNNLSHYYNVIVQDWETLTSFLSLPVTDIIIGGFLGFSIKDVSLKAKQYNKKIRCYCNQCQSLQFVNTSSIKSFFIRPEDLDLYEDYIDTLEFDTKDNNPILVNSLYKIYIKDKKWFGKLNEIIVNYKGEEDNKFIITRFGDQRLNCHKKCLSSSLGCDFCNTFVDLSNTLKKTNIWLKTERIKNG